jgi:SAM-dependent methyltransferase
MTTQTQQGTSGVQGPLWSERADDWAELMEPQMKPAFEAALDALAVGPKTRLLDVGCGSGLALRLAADRGADVTGLDASTGLLVHARRRVPGATIVEGEIESSRSKPAVSTRSPVSIRSSTPPAPRRRSPRPCASLRRAGVCST